MLRTDNFSRSYYNWVFLPKLECKTEVSFRDMAVSEGMPPSPVYKTEPCRRYQHARVIAISVPHWGLEAFLSFGQDRSSFPSLPEKTISPKLQFNSIQYIDGERVISITKIIYLKDSHLHTLRVCILVCLGNQKWKFLHKKMDPDFDIRKTSNPSS